MPNNDRELNIIYSLAATLLPGVGSVNAKKLIAFLGSCEAIFKEKESAIKKIPGIGQIISKQIIDHRSKAIEIAKKELLYTQKNNIEVIFFQEITYPSRLKQCEDGPIILFKKGNVEMNTSKVIAIVGTRNATQYGKTHCQKIIENLSHHKDLLIVSGLAYGIDICAHKEAIQNNIPTLGVLGHGLDTIYPGSHRETSQKMIDHAGGLLTEFFSNVGPDKENFPKRNRIVAGIADALLVIESDIKGGSMITAHIADSYNRDILALPGPVDAPYSNGCNYLIKNLKASLVENAGDIEKLLGWETVKISTQKQTQLFIDLTHEEQIIINLLKQHGNLKIDDIAIRSNLKVSDVSSALLNLEFNFFVNSLPGKIYSLV